jgi:hypothetical protein
VKGSLYLGLRDCPQWIIDDAVSGKHLGYGAAWAGRDATVYYDPTDPSRNSLLDFRAQSEIAYRVATPWVALAGLIVFFFVLGKLMVASERRGNGGRIVDVQGTVIYPKEIGLNSGPDSRHPGTLNSVPSPTIKQLPGE